MTPSFDGHGDPPDLRTLSLPAFVDLVFDHPAYEGQDVELDGDRIVRILEKRPRQWYWDVAWEWDTLPAEPLHTLSLMTQLFEAPECLRTRFTPRQVAQGFGLIVGPAGENLFLAPLWNADLPWRPRERFLRAALPLYERLFDVQVDIEHVPFMFWDSLLGYRFIDGIGPRTDPDEARHIQDTIAEVIEQQLQLDGPWSVPGALHGAHHVNHPRSFAAVERWLAALPDRDGHWPKYAEAVLRGEAM